MQYLGILLGALYGFILRLITGQEILADDVYLLNLYSISFLWVVPLGISIIPILFAKKELLESRSKQFLFPLLSVLLFFLVTLTTGFEDWLCILILVFPCIITAGLIGIIAGYIVSSKHSNKLYSVLLLPLFMSPLESAIDFKEQTFSVERNVIITEDPSIVWNYLIEVPEIKEDEYTKGIYNYLGVPRPVKSVLEKEGEKAYRIGYFTGGLELKESIYKVKQNEFVEFHVDIKNSKLRNTPTDQHILKSDHFRFDNIRYELHSLDDKSTQLVLSCEYSINSNMNWYARFWADQILGDFEKRVLDVLKLKIEKDSIQY